MDEIETLLPSHSHLPAGLLDFLIVLGVILLVALIAVFWAFAIRKRKNRIRKHHHHHRKGIREQFQKNAGDIKELIRERRHGHRHENRPLNPTLAQTGGLPPLRESDKPSQPPPPQ